MPASASVVGVAAVVTVGRVVVSVADTVSVDIASDTVPPSDSTHSTATGSSATAAASTAPTSTVGSGSGSTGPSTR